MMMTYTGSKSRRLYTIPMNYFRMSQVGSEYLATPSLLERVWWRNLRGGADVIVHLQGQDYLAASGVIEDEGMLCNRLKVI